MLYSVFTIVKEAGGSFAVCKTRVAIGIFIYELYKQAVVSD